MHYLRLDSLVVLYTQISKDKLPFNIKFNLDWITNLIKDGIIEKYIFTKGEIEIGIHYSEKNQMNFIKLINVLYIKICLKMQMKYTK